MGPMDGPIGTGTEAHYFETSVRPKLLYIETYKYTTFTFRVFQLNCHNQIHHQLTIIMIWR